MPEMRLHPAVALTDATQPFYERLAALKLQWQAERTLALRYEIASITQELWKVARNGNGYKQKLPEVSEATLRRQEP